MQINNELKWASGLMVGCSLALVASVQAEELPPVSLAAADSAHQVPAPYALVPDQPSQLFALQTHPPADGTAKADEQPYLRDWWVSSGDWGGVGLLQTPGAHMHPASSFGLSFHRAWPYRHANLLLQPFDDLEVTMRYTGVTNRPYHPSIPERAYMDKSLELKYRVFKESGNMPDVSVGMRDPLGTGLFSGEYLVAGKHLGDFDLSLGLGWGYMAGRGHISNPLGFLNSSFKTRQSADSGEGGVPRTKSWFTGPVGVFGGVQWKTPIDSLVLKLEYDGNNYNSGAGGSGVVQKSPLNVGLLWRYSTLDVSLALERGNRLALNFGWTFDGNRMKPMQITQPLELVGPGRASAGEGQGDPEKMMETWRKHTGWGAFSLHQQGNAYTVDVDNPGGTYVKERLDQGVKVLDHFAPDNIDKFVFRFHGYKVPVTNYEVKRPELALDQEKVGQPYLAEKPSTSVPPQAEPGFKTLYQSTAHDSSFKVEPIFEQTIGSPDGYLYALSARARGHFQLWKGGWVNSTVKYRLADNYDRMNYSAPTGLSRVRTDLPLYLKTSRLTIPNLQFNQMNKWGNDVYSLGYVGLLESMYAGAGLEMLYRPDQSNFGVGFDVNAVRQRDFDQGFSFKDYRVVTGHVNAYWDTKWNGVQVNVAAGRYLAGDKGVTLGLARVFDNGIAMGVWATKTNVSAAQFGEGSFDKGVYISIPLDAMFKGVSGVGSLTWHPLVRDGGARLARSYSLWGLTRLRDSRAMQYSTSPEH